MVGFAFGSSSVALRRARVKQIYRKQELPWRAHRAIIPPVLPSLLTTFLWSISIACASRAARVLGGMEANFWRLVIAAIFLGAYANIFGQGASGVAFPFFLLSGVIGLGADIFLFQALPRIGARLSTLLIQCGSAMLAPIVEWLWLGTRLTPFQIVCCGTILAGVAVSLAPGKHLEIPRRTLLAGIAFGVIGSFGNGMGAVLTRKGYEVAAAAHQRIDDPTSAYQRMIGGLFVAGVFLLLSRRRAIAAQLADPRLSALPPGEKWRVAWPWVAANAVAGQTLGVICYQWALHTTPTGLVLAVVATTPLVIIPFAYLFEGERPHFRSVSGGLIAVTGVILLLASRR